MKTGKIVAALSLLSFVAAWNPAAVAGENFSIDAAAQNAVTRSDHEAVAKQYEDAAKELQTKVQEQKSRLEQYESKSYFYGRQAQDLQAHAHALIRKYDKEVEANIKEAALHRQMAMQLEENIHSAAGLQRLSAVDQSDRNSVSAE